jgi:hypothetical protein
MKTAAVGLRTHALTQSQQERGEEGDDEETEKPLTEDNL